MKTHSRPLNKDQGSILVTTIILTVAALMIIGSVLQIATSDNAANFNQQLRLDAKYAAESVAEYTNAQAAKKLSYIKDLGTAVDLSSITLPPSTAFTGTNIYGADTNTDTKLAVKMYYDRANNRFTVDGTQREYQGDANAGSTIFAACLSTVSRGNARDPRTGRVITSYLYEQIQVRSVPLFNYAIFYNPLMELSAGAEFNIVGPVHSNRNMIFDPYQGTAIFKFHSRLTTAGTFKLGDSSDGGDTAWTTLAARMRILPAGAADTDANLKTFADLYSSNPFATASGDYVMDNLNTGTDTFKKKSTEVFGSNFGTVTHGVALMNLPAMGDYSDTAGGPNESHQLIENSVPASTIDAIADTADKEKKKGVEAQKYANAAGLYIDVDYSTGTATAYKYVADGSGTVYRAADDGTISKYKREAVSLPAGVVTVQTSTTKATGFYDARRNRWIKMANVDVGKLKSAIDGTTTISNYNLNSDWNGVVYVNAAENPSDTSNYPGNGVSGTDYGTGVRLINGSQIPSRGTNAGMSIATNAAMYVQGNFNADGVNLTDVTALRDPDANDTGKPAAIIADAVTILSGAWDDAKSTGYISPSKYANKTLYRNKATDTEISAAILTGITPTSGSTVSGGANNLVRFLEEWNKYSNSNTSVSTLAMRGSNVILFRSTAADGPFLGAGAGDYSSASFNSASKIGIYNAGNRNWVFSKMFEQGTFPPWTPKARTFVRTVHREVTKDFYDSFSTTAATAEPGYIGTLTRPY